MMHRKKLRTISTSLGKLLKRKKNDVVSGICPRRDCFNQNANDVNQLLAGKCGENGSDYIPHNNINTRLHLNRDGLHLNRKGIYQISCNFKDYLIMVKMWSKSAKRQSH